MSIITKREVNATMWMYFNKSNKWLYTVKQAHILSKHNKYDYKTIIMKFNTKLNYKWINNMLFNVIIH